MRYFKKNSGDIRDNLSKKGMNHSPSTWEQFVCEHHESFETLRQELLDSQEGYCAYCEKRINIEKSHIDHYFPRSSFSNLTFKKENLYLSCMSKNHCGHAKDNMKECKNIDIKKTKRPDELINGEKIENFLFYTREGRIKVLPRSDLSPDDNKKLENTIKKLNLNDNSLVNDRKNNFRIIDYMASAPNNFSQGQINESVDMPSLIAQYFKDKS